MHSQSFLHSLISQLSERTGRRKPYTVLTQGIRVPVPHLMPDCEMYAARKIPRYTQHHGTHRTPVHDETRHSLQHCMHHSTACTAPQHTFAKVCTAPWYAAQCTMARTALTHKRHSYDKGQTLLLSLTSHSQEGALPQGVTDHSRGLMTLTSHKPSTADTQSGHSLDTVLSALSTKGLSQAGRKFLEAAQA